MQIPDTFDARTVQPQQGVGAHPPGMFDFQITNTYLQVNKENTGAMLVVEFTTPAGRIENRYNIVHNTSPKAVEIAQKELSALCHAVNIHQVAYPKNPDGTPVMNMAGHTLRGGRGRVEIGPQLNKDGTPNPNGYMEVKKVFDSQGNEPGKGPQQAPQTQGWGNQQQPQPQNQGGGWAGQPPQGQAQPAQQAQPQPNQAWQPGPTQQQPQQQPAPQQQGWQQGNQQQPPQGGPAPWSR